VTEFDPTQTPEDPDPSDAPPPAPALDAVSPLSDDADPFGVVDLADAVLPDIEDDGDDGFLGFLYELPILILVALVVAVVIKTFLIGTFYIPSVSMVPTLEVDDRVMVNKLAFIFDEPAAGDIVVFDSPFRGDKPDESLVDKVVRNVTESLGLRSNDAEDDLIKRIVAVAGDTVEIRENTVIVNGVPRVEPYLAADASMPDMEATVIPPGTIWVMGDNRSRSQDSRRFGPVDVDTIIGRAFVRVWPFDRFGSLR
jgi:signal peptidase I